MKTRFQLMILATAMTLAACAHEQAPDTRMNSFTYADTNKDQRLSYGEYKAYLSAQADRGDITAQKVIADGHKNLEKAKLQSFQSRDYNRDTFVTWDELAN